jgi:prepilin-type N-terminal cleavage/methylation domain-containing protein
MRIKKKHCKQFNVCLGFTLAELLIALAILGLISVYTIPKMISSWQEHQKNVLFKDMIAMYEALGWDAAQSNQTIEQALGRSIADGKLNVVKKTNFSLDDFIVTYSNGVEVVHLVTDMCNLTALTMDYNGYAKGPNLPGEDIFCGRIKLKTMGSCVFSDFRGPAPMGRVFVSTNCKVISPSGMEEMVDGTFYIKGATMYRAIFGQ